MTGQIDEDRKVRIGGWTRGINNVKEESALSPDELLDSVNYEYDPGGRPKLRHGRTKVVAGTKCHSLWSNGSKSFYVDDGALLQLDTETWLTTELATGFGNESLAYAQIANRLFLSNSEKSGRVDLATSDFLPGLGTPTPALNTSVTAQSFGGLQAGRYLVGITYEDASKEESGCPGVVSAQVEAGGSILLSMTGPRPSGAAYIRVYLSEPNGRREEMYAYARIDAAETQLQISTADTGRPLETLYLETMPPCRRLTAYNGRLYAAIGNEVIYSEAQRYGLYDPDAGSLGVFPDNVAVLEHGEDAIFVGSDRTYSYVGSGPGAMAYRDDAFSHAAVPGSGKPVPSDVLGMEGLPDGDIPYWFTDRGAVIGIPGGRVRPIMKGAAEPDRFGSGATGLVEIGGVSQVVTALQNRTGPSDSIAMADSFGVRVIKNGISDPVDP